MKSPGNSAWSCICLKKVFPVILCGLLIMSIHLHDIRYLFIFKIKGRVPHGFFRGNGLRLYELYLSFGIFDMAQGIV